MFIVGHGLHQRAAAESVLHPSWPALVGGASRHQHLLWHGLEAGSCPAPVVSF